MEKEKKEHLSYNKLIIEIITLIIISTGIWLKQSEKGDDNPGPSNDFNNLPRESSPTKDPPPDIDTADGDPSPNGTLRGSSPPALDEDFLSEISGIWYSLDRSVKWEFDDGRIQISSSDAMPGMLSGFGSYHQDENYIHGTILLSEDNNQPVNQEFQIYMNITNNGQTIIGTSTFLQGPRMPFSLYR